MASVCKQIVAMKLIERAALNYCLESQCIHTSAVVETLGGWRLRHGIPAKGREYGPLTDLPDWSYADGRPAPLQQAKRKRIKLHKEYCEKIIKLTKEVDECLELNQQKAAMEEARRQNAIHNRLKAKGDSLIK
ncbi:39S ribosomal protein L52, mitochondrial-like [Stegodyphus dumicola]|uniref:39S ribosomal protein L52, mitochondrial-like n=1 Tax=Stegodyphus dumicola TaxID=202533 RepID=UPI0015B03D53|nr:39S ribosomal protein L52, mitochondrial-like [Stegodyphus dumicola]